MPSEPRPRVMMIGPFPPGVGGLANNMRLLMGSGLAERFQLIPFSTTKRRRRVFPNRPHWDSFPYLAFHTVKLLVSILRHRPHAVYLKATSDTGFVRDAVLMGVARTLGKPVLCHLHGRPMGSLFKIGNGWKQGFVRRGMRQAAATIVLSPGLAEQFQGLFPGQRLVPVPNVVDLDHFSPGSGNGSAPVRVLTVGRLSREKGTWDLLEVARHVHAAGVPAAFRLIGIGETADEEKALRARAAELGLNDSVAFCGTLRGDALVREYREADIFFLPTHAEIFPNVVLEALASGLPVVTTDVPVIPEMFDHGVQGFLHPPGDLEAMTGSLVHLATKTDVRREMGRAARSLAEARYGVPAAAEAIGDLLNELVERG